jgi:anti-sigma factor RsiW
VRTGADYYAAPASLRDGILARLDATPPRAPHGPSNARSRHWLGRIGLAAGAAAIASIATVLLVHPAPNDLTEHDVFAAHARATVSDRLFDVASSDRHAVKPWLSARLGFSPPVPDLSGSGFELLGGRIDVVGRQRIAVIVYRRRQHVIDVLVRPARSETRSVKSTRDGLNLIHFTQNGMAFWLISDLSENELGDLARMLAVSAGP